MVRKTKQLYMCEECNLKYKTKELAEKCEVWCKKYKSCNLEITKHAINKSRIRRRLESIAIKAGFTGTIAFAVLSFIGFTGLCCFPLVLVFLGLFGLSSGMFLMTNKWIFLVISVIFLLLLMILYKLRRK